MAEARIPVGWLVENKHQAEAAEVDLELDEVVYVLTVRDVAAVYRKFILENPDAPEGEPTWEELDDERKAGLINLAIEYVEKLDFPWDEAIEQAILDQHEL